MSELTRILSALAGDIETIVAKALDKDKELCYFSAGSLGADIRRHLKGRGFDPTPCS